MRSSSVKSCYDWKEFNDVSAARAARLAKSETEIGRTNRNLNYIAPQLCVLNACKSDCNLQSNSTEQYSAHSSADKLYTLIIFARTVPGPGAYIQPYNA